jgi:predicted alpha-1,2-mannosidase
VRSRAVLFVIAAACGDNAESIAPEVTDPVAFVDPRIGTGGLGFAHGSCFVGAAVPHGLVKLGPDTSGPFGIVNFLHYSGYFAEDDQIQGFSHVHLHGAGATDYGVLSVMPVVAFDPNKRSVAANQTRFAKHDEHAAAGRYEVTLANGIKAELTATTRTGVHRYTGAGAVVIDLGKTLSGGEIDSAQLTVEDGAISGQLHHLGGMTGGFGGYTVYFVIRGAWSSVTAWSETAAPAETAIGQAVAGTGVGAALAVGADAQLAVGISLVSLEGARKNLDAEVPAIDFDIVAAAARETWSSQLSSVLVTGGSEAERRIFYTSLYHAFLMPSVIEDVDGAYVFANVAEPRQSSGWRQMSDLSLWDTYRTVHPLYAWLAPESAKDSARSLVSFGDGIGIFPKWPLAIGETGTMLGASAEIVIADSTLRGIDVSADLAWPALRAAAMDPVAPPAGRGGRGGVEPYLDLAYVPRDLGIGRTVSLTTEFAHDDFALGNLAGHLGNTADADALHARSRGWRMLFDPAVGFLRGRNADGSFPSESFDPLELGDDYAEANAWHSLWMAGAHDPAGLAEIFGGDTEAIAKLEMFFDNAKLDFDTADESAANFPRPYYWHGNEPDMNAAYVFAQLGRRDLTTTWVRWIQDSLYSDQPSGVAGNDDGGTLGAWYVLSALGVYPIPGSDRWILGEPRFPQARVLVGGRELVITIDSNGEPGTVEIDGVAVTAAELTHTQLVNATSLHFVR